MSRRMDREGVTDGDFQRMANRRYWAEQKRRLLPIYTPFAVSDGFEELGKAHWHRHYRLWVLRNHLTPYERAEHQRRARLHLSRTRTCDRPRLP